MKIAIVGNIGTGKTTVIQKLNHVLRLPIFLEPVEEWKDWLEVFYKDHHRWGFTFNVNVLTSFVQWKNNNFKAIYERSPMCCRYVFTDLQYEEGYMTDMEMELFDKLYQQLAWEPDVIIYVRTSPVTCSHRIVKRGRVCEAKVPLDYIEKVHDKYESMVSNCKQPVHIVDGEQDEEAVFQNILQIIRNI